MIASIHHDPGMRSRTARILAAIYIGGSGAGCSSESQRGGNAPFCPLPDSGEPCTCPGTSVCTGPKWVEFKCLDDGSWLKTHLSCGPASCTSSADCMSGQACCGAPYTDSSGTQITSSSCQSAPCSSDTVQICRDSAECVQADFVCGGPDLTYGSESVSSCEERPN